MGLGLGLGLGLKVSGPDHGTGNTLYIIYYLDIYDHDHDHDHDDDDDFNDDDSVPGAWDVFDRISAIQVLRGRTLSRFSMPPMSQAICSFSLLPSTPTLVGRHLSLEKQKPLKIIGKRSLAINIKRSSISMLPSQTFFWTVIGNPPLKLSMYARYITPTRT